MTEYDPAYVVNYGVNASHIMMVCSLHDNFDDAKATYDSLDTETWKAARFVMLEFDRAGFVNKETEIEAYNYS